MSSELNDFCKENLPDIVKTANENTQALQLARIANDATEVNERLALARAESEKYRMEQVRMFNESLKVCQALAGDPQKVCLERLPSVSLQLVEGPRPAPAPGGRSIAVTE